MLGEGQWVNLEMPSWFKCGQLGLDPWTFLWRSVPIHKTQCLQLTVEEALEAKPCFGLVGVSGVILQTVGKHQLHIFYVLHRCFVYTVINLLPNGAQGNGLLDNVIVVWYLSPGDQLHEGPTILMSDQFYCQLFQGRELMDTVVPS